MSVGKKCIAADLRLTQQSLPFVSVWVCYIATGFIQCGELVLHHTDKESNNNSASFHESFPSQ